MTYKMTTQHTVGQTIEIWRGWKRPGSSEYSDSCRVEEGVVTDIRENGDIVAMSENNFEIVFDSSGDSEVKSHLSRCLSRIKLY